MGFFRKVVVFKFCNFFQYCLYCLCCLCCVECLCPPGFFRETLKTVFYLHMKSCYCTCCLIYSRKAMFIKV